MAARLKGWAQSSTDLHVHSIVYNRQGVNCKPVTASGHYAFVFCKQNDLMKFAMAGSGSVGAMASEEDEDVVALDASSQVAGRSKCHC